MKLSQFHVIISLIWLNIASCTEMQTMMIWGLIASFIHVVIAVVVSRKE
jgi:hypothetical protein